MQDANKDELYERMLAGWQELSRYPDIIKTIEQRFRANKK